jgi:hypothetical protein
MKPQIIILIYAIGFAMLALVLGPFIYGLYWYDKTDHELRCYLAKREGYAPPTCESTRQGGVRSATLSFQ